MGLFSYSGYHSNNKLIKPRQKKKKIQYGEKMEKLKSDFKWIGVLKAKYHTPQCQLMTASNSGVSDEDVLAMECNCNGPVEEGIKNTVLTNGLVSIINKLIDKDNENTVDGFITHLEIGLSDTASASGQTGTILPIARKPIVQALRSSTNAVFKTFFNGTQGNSYSTQITIGTSTTQFNVLSGTGSNLTVGESIQVDLSGGAENTEISNISVDTIQVSPALSGIPSGGEDVKQLIVEMTLWGTSNASDSLGTGVCFARTTNFTPRVKDPNYGMTIEWHITLT